MIKTTASYWETGTDMIKTTASYWETGIALLEMNHIGTLLDHVD
jgi:hypothetical protein